MSESLASTIDHGTRVIAPQVRLRHLQGPADVIFVTVTAGRQVFFGFGDGSVGTMPLQSASTLSLETLALGGLPICGTTDVDGASVLLGFDDGRLLSLAAGLEVETLLALPETRSERWINALAATPASGLRACASGRSVWVLDAGGVLLGSLAEHPSTVSDVCFSPDGRSLAVAHYGGVSVWELDDASVLPERRQLLAWHGSHTRVRWSPDGRFLVSALQENELHCWRMPQAKGMRMSGYPAKIRSLSWTADGRCLAVSGADTVTTWSFGAEGPSARPPGEFGYVHEGVVHQVAAHPSEHVVAGGYSDGTVLAGSIERETAIMVRPGEGAAVSALAWAPQGDALVAGSRAGEIAVCFVDALC